MSPLLCSPVDPQLFYDPANYHTFFTPKDQRTIRSFDSREKPSIGNPLKTCEENLFLGFFFDGTRNNYAVSDASGLENHSNIARLFDAYPGQTLAPATVRRAQPPWPNLARYPNYFRIYTSGVGTAFEEVGDSGQGLDSLADAEQSLRVAPTLKCLHLALTTPV